MSKEIVILVDPEGNTSVEAFGYTGKGCVDATKVFEEALGAAGTRKMKREALVAEKAGTKTTVRRK